MDAAVAAVLNKVLGDWLEDIDSDALNVSVFRGSIHLGPIKVRTEAIDKLGLPFQLRYGCVNRIDVEVDWFHLASKPLIITIQGVYVLLTTRPSDEWSADIELKNQIAREKSKLKDFEVLNAEAFKEFAEEPGRMERLVISIVDNLQLNIEGLYVRLEDRTAALEPFAAGVTLGKLDALTCDSSWQPHYTQDADLTYKRATMENFSVFIDTGRENLFSPHFSPSKLADSFESLAKKDILQQLSDQHHFLLSPISATLHARYSKNNKGFSVPLLDVDFLLGTRNTLGLGLETIQLSHVLKLVEFFMHFMKFQTGILAKLNQRKWSEYEAEKYRLAYKTWKRQPSGQLLSAVEMLEKGHSYEEIAAQRTLVSKEILIENKEKRLQEEVKQYQESSSGVVSGLKDFFGWGNKEAEEAERRKKLAQATSHLAEIQEDKRNLLFEFKAGLLDSIKKPTDPPDYEKIKIKAKIPKVSFAFVTGNRALVSGEQGGVQVNVVVRPETVRVEAVLGSMLVLDQVVKSPIYPYLLKTGNFMCVFNQRIDGLPAELTISAEELRFIANFPCLTAIIVSILDPFTSVHVKSIITQKIRDIISAGEAQMTRFLQGNYHYIPLDLDIKIKAPCLILPLDISLPQNCVVLDFGSIETNTDFAKGKREYFAGKVEEKGLYDVYTWKGKDVKMGVLWSFSEVDQWENGDFELFFEHPMFSFCLASSVLKEIAHFPVIIFKAILGELKIFLSDRQLLMFFHLQKMILGHIKSILPVKTENPDSETTKTDSKSALKSGKNLLSLEKVIAQHVEVSFSQFFCQISSSRGPLLTLKLNDMRTIISISASENILFDFSIREIQAENSVQQSIISKPFRDIIVNFDIGADSQFEYHNSKIAENSMLWTDSQVCLRVKVQPKESIVEALLSLANVRVVVRSELAEEMMRFGKEIVEVVERERSEEELQRSESQPIAAIPRVSGSKRTNTTQVTKILQCRLVTVLFQDLEICLPQNPDSLSKVINLYIAGNFRFDSNREIQVKSDALGNTTGTDYDAISDEATIDIEKIGVSVGYLQDTGYEKANQWKSDILMPTRLCVEYVCRNDTGPTVTNVESEVESFDIMLGFRDVLLMKSLVSTWSALLPKSKPEENPVLMHTESYDDDETLQERAITRSTTEFKANIRLRSIEATLIDDTSAKLRSLLYLELNNVSSSVNHAFDLLNVSFSTGVRVKFFNGLTGSWEPVVEEWAMEVSGKQADLRVPIEVEMNSETMLNVNFSYQMAETVSHILNTLSKAPQEWSNEEELSKNTSPDEHSTITYKVKNRLGTNIKLWIETGTAALRDIWTLETGKSREFSQSDVDNIRMKNIAESQQKYVSLMQNTQAATAISVEIDTFQAVENMRIEDPGVRSVGLTSSKDAGNKAFIVDIVSRKGRKVVNLESLVKVLNNTNLTIELMHRGRAVEIPPNRAVPLPLSWVDSVSPVELATASKQVEIRSFTGLVDYNESVKIAVDYVVVQSGSVEITDEVQLPHQKVIIFNPAYTVHNLTPGVLSMYREGSPDPVFSLIPGGITHVNNTNTSNLPVQKWTVRLDSEHIVETQYFTPTKSLHQERLSGNITADRLTFERSPMNLVNVKNWDLQVQNVLEEQWHGVGVQVYFQFWILNKTPYPLEFGGKGNTLVIPRESVGSVKDTKAQMKVRLPEEVFGKPSSWSKPFNIRTVGIAGSLQLETSSIPSGDPIPTTVQLGIRLKNAPWPLIKSVIVSIQPRFILTNYLDYPLFLRQHQQTHVLTLQSKESLPYQFDNAKLSSTVEVSCDQMHWSSPFPMEDIDDIQLRFQSQVAVIGGYSLEDTRIWHRANPSNDFFHYIRAVISTEDEATLFVSFTYPIDPEFTIRNLSKVPISICQVGCEVVTHITPGKTACFAYDNHLAESKKVRIQLEGFSNEYAIEKLRESKRKLGEYKVKIFTEGVTRVVLVQPEVSASLIQTVNHPLSGRVEYRFQNVSLRVRFQGCVVSFIDDFPCERLVFSMTDVMIKMKQLVEPTIDTKRITRALKVRIGNIQLDDMHATGAQFPVVLGHYGVKQEPGEEPVPFFQFRFEWITTISDVADDFAEMLHFKHVGLLVQPIYVQIHQEMVMGLLGVAVGLQAAFARKQAAWETLPVEDIDYMKVCPDFHSSLPVLSYNAGQSSSKAYFELVNLNAMKIILSFRSSSRKTTLKIDPRQAFGVVSVIRTVGSAMLNITDSPLRFSNVILLHSFQTIQAMTWVIAKNYIRQGALQFYKVIGSSDMLGNPIGLIDKLGTGVFEFFNEPRKGLLKGPKAFAMGVGKGVKSLVSGVVSGGFGSVSRITGSLYSVVRQVGGDENSYERINRNDTAGIGIYHGLKGGLQDLGEGVTGLFTKPFRGAKAGGVTGFFKGMGRGIIGLATAPLSAVLRVGTSVTSGIANSATLLRTGKIQQRGRIRFPRPFSARKILEPYNEEIAQAQEFLRTLKKFSDQQLVFYLRVTQATIVLITSTYALKVHEGDVESHVRLSEVEVCQVHWAKKNYVLLVSGKRGKMTVTAEEYPGLARLFAVFSLTTKGGNPNQTLPNELAKGYRDRCC